MQISYKVTKRLHFPYNKTQSVTGSDLTSPTRSLHFSSYMSVPVSITILFYCYEEQIVYGRTAYGRILSVLTVSIGK